MAFGLLVTERVRNDLSTWVKERHGSGELGLVRRKHGLLLPTCLVALLIILALGLSGLLKPDEALAGFGSEPAIVVVAIFVMSGALYQTGVSETLGAWIGRLAGQSFARMITIIMPSVALLSAFTHPPRHHHRRHAAGDAEPRPRARHRAFQAAHAAVVRGLARHHHHHHRRAGARRRSWSPAASCSARVGQD